MLDWLDASVPAGCHAADLVALHRSFYEAARTMSGLPARSSDIRLQGLGPPPSGPRRSRVVCHSMKKLYIPSKESRSVSIATLKRPNDHTFPRRGLLARGLGDQSAPAGVE